MRTDVSISLPTPGNAKAEVLSEQLKNDAQKAFDGASADVAGQTGVCHAGGLSFDRSACEASYNSAWDDLQAAKNRSTAALLVAGAGVVAAGVGMVLVVSSPGARVAPAVGVRSFGLVGEF